jgi:hypothetical protein
MPKKYKGKRDPIYNGAVAPLLYLVKAIMVLFVATFPEAHIFVVASGAIRTTGVTPGALQTTQGFCTSVNTG